MKLKNNLDARRLTPPKSDNVVSIKGIQDHNIPYILVWIIYYAWIISFATWWTSSPLVEKGFSTELRGLIHIIILISSGVFIFTIKKQWFIKLARLGAIIVVISMSLFIISKDPQIKTFSVIIMGIALGSVSASILIPFVFTLNNTEKLYSILGANVLINLISLFQEWNNGSHLLGKWDMVISFIMLILGLSLTLSFKENSLDTSHEKFSVDVPLFHSRIYMTLFFNCIFVILCKGVGKGILNNNALTSGYPTLIWYYLGGLVGCMVYPAVYAFSKRSFVWLGNITFGIFTIGLLCNAFIVQMPEMAIVYAFLLGLGSTVGVINIYYIVGVIGKKYDSMNYLRLSVLSIGICGGILGFIIGKIIHGRNTFIISTIATIFSVVVMLLFIMLSAVMAQYYDDWAKDSENIEIDNEHIFMFKKYNLSKREIEVCKLLLQGYTMRQVSGILSIAYPTVNTYCTTAYRKLEINSKTELMLLFKEYSLNNQIST